MYVQRNIQARSSNNCSRRKETYYIFWVCVCSVSYPARKAHTPVWLYHIFPHYLV